MLLDQRREKILQVIENKGFVSLGDLVERLKSSESTIRRDLEHLDRIGQIRRTRGGAAYVGESLSTFDERRHQSVEQKKTIARKVAELIHSGEVILLDGGTTTLEVARELIGKPLQVVTNSLPIANLLVNQPNIELILIGGYLYPKTGVALGPISLSALEKIHVRRLIISVGGINEQGLYNSNSLLVDTERQMIASADEVIVVSDSSKLGHSALSQICSLEEIDRLVIDEGIDEHWMNVFKKANVEVIVAT